MKKAKKNNYNELETILEEFQNELDNVNSILAYPKKKSSPYITQYRNALIKDIQDVSEHLLIMGLDPSKIRNIDCLLSL